MSRLMDLRFRDDLLTLRVTLSCGCVVWWDPSFACGWRYEWGHRESAYDGHVFVNRRDRHQHLHGVTLKPEHVAAGFAMAAARGVGPWAPYFPHKLVGTNETLPEALDAVGRELVGGL
ncbi:MAG: hypothetical protein AMXMBFR56_68340 [Polyangiaceae bacterium]